MTDAQLDLLALARDSVLAARLLLANGYPSFAASRAYYAMFYIAEAFLEGKALAFSKHSAAIAAFGKEFAKTGLVPAEFHRYLVDGEDLRHVADYGPRKSVDPERAQRQIERAEAFLRFAEESIGPIPPGLE